VKQQQEEEEERKRRWRIVGIFKILKIMFNSSLAYNTSLSVFKSLGKSLEHFIDKSKAWRAAFGEHSIREF